MTSVFLWTWIGTLILGAIGRIALIGQEIKVSKVAASWAIINLICSGAVIWFLLAHYAQLTGHC